MLPLRAELIWINTSVPRFRYFRGMVVVQTNHGRLGVMTTNCSILALIASMAIAGPAAADTWTVMVVPTGLDQWVAVTTKPSLADCNAYRTGVANAALAKIEQTQDIVEKIQLLNTAKELTSRSVCVRR